MLKISFHYKQHIIVKHFSLSFFFFILIFLLLLVKLSLIVRPYSAGYSIYNWVKLIENVCSEIAYLYVLFVIWFLYRVLQDELDCLVQIVIRPKHHCGDAIMSVNRFVMHVDCIINCITFSDHSLWKRTQFRWVNYSFIIN